MGRHRIYDDETRRERHRAAQRAWYARQKAARPPRPPRVAPETKAKAVEMVRAGQSINSVARVLGYSPAAVWKWCRRNGVASHIRKHAPEPAPVAPPTPAPEPDKNGVIVNATDSRSLMTTAGYIFTTILFHIPVIGLIFMFVWGCGRPKNLSRKRFALACLLMRLIAVIFVLSVAVFLLICYSDKFPILTDAFTRFFA